MQFFTLMLKNKLKPSCLLVKNQRLYSVLFFGTDNFSLPSLELLKKHKISPLEVVTSFKAKNNPVKLFAETSQIPVHDWEAVKSNDEICRRFDFGLVVSFGHLIPENIIKRFRHGMLNVHSSLLPKYRGASPIIYAIKNHERITGVSIMKIEPNKFDVGDVFASRKVPIGEDVLMPELHDKLANAGADLLIECLQYYDKLHPVKQDLSQVSYAPKINKDFCKVRWESMTALQVYDLYRSVYSFKHLTTTFRNEAVKLLEINKSNRVQQAGTQLNAGHLKYCWKTKRLFVTCADRNEVEIIKLSIGKKNMFAADFNNGYLKNSKENKFH